MVIVKFYGLLANREIVSGEKGCAAAGEKGETKPFYGFSYKNQSIFYKTGLQV